MDRRAFLASAAALLAVPLAAAAQQAGKVYRIGALESTPNPRMEDVLRQGLRELGWVEGQNLIFERRYSGGRDDRHPAHAAELSQLVLTYVDQHEFDGERGFGGSARLQTAFAAAREPWVSGFDPSLLHDDLDAVGFTLLEDLDGREIKDLYCPGRPDLLPMAASHIVHAAVQ